MSNKPLIGKVMTVMVLSKEAEKIHQALMTAATASALGQKVHLFFAKEAAKVLMEDGWREFRTSLGYTTKNMDANLDEKGVADFTILMEGLNSMHVKFYVCEKTVAEYDLDILDFIDRPSPKIAALTDIITHGSGGDWLTF